MSSFYASSKENVSEFGFRHAGPSIVSLHEDYFGEEEEYEDFESIESFHKPVESILDYGLHYKKVDKNDEDYEEEEDYESYGARHPSRYDLTKFEVGDSDRDEIIAKLKELHQDANVLSIKNKFLHRHYIESMKNNLGASALGRFDEITIFEDHRYITELDEYSQVRDELHKNDSNLIAKLNDFKENYAKAKADFEEIYENLTSMELEVGKKIKPLMLDKKTWNNQLNEMFEIQQNQVNIITKIRMDYLKLRQKFMKLQSRNSPNLGSGLTVLDYEFLLKKKSVYQEKLAEQKGHIQLFEHKVLAMAASIKHVDEESELYAERVNNAIERLLAITKENMDEHHKFVKLAKQRALTFKRILKLKEISGLLGIPFSINKMEYDIIELSKLQKKLENMKMRMLVDNNKN